MMAPVLLTIGFSVGVIITHTVYYFNRKSAAKDLSEILSESKH
ncbi:MAG: hypothetical protein ABJG41_01505 [Cyclobacteriaceae bacterium]